MPRHENAWVWALVVLAVASAGGVARAATAPIVSPIKPMTLQELREFAASVGFPDPVLAAAIAMAESGDGIHANPSAQTIVTHPLPGNGPERSFGLWQVNTLAHAEFDERALLDPAYNAHAALLISKSGTDWSPWSTFHPGPHGEPPAYLKYMGGAA